MDPIHDDGVGVPVDVPQQREGQAMERGVRMPPEAGPEDERLAAQAGQTVTYRHGEAVGEGHEDDVDVRSPEPGDEPGRDPQAGCQMKPAQVLVREVAPPHAPPRVPVLLVAGRDEQEADVHPAGQRLIGPDAVMRTEVRHEQGPDPAPAAFALGDHAARRAAARGSGARGRA